MILTLLAILPAISASAQTPPAATDITAADVQAFIKALPPNAVADKPIRVVDVGGYHVGLFGVLRPKGTKQEAILHETRTAEVYQILEGSATLVTGGTIIDGKSDGKAKSANVRGPRIDGGVSRHVSKGDFIIIPGRLPHWFSSLDSDLTYLIVRPDIDGELPLK